jgi:hypothetical protein
VGPLYAYRQYQPALVRTGQAPQAPVPPPQAPGPPPPPQDQPIYVTFGPGALSDAFKQVTPALLVVGIFTGAAFAIGGALGSYLVGRIHKRSG